MRACHFECSSRKNRELPLRGAVGRGGAGCTETVCGGQKCMRHNKGLCRIAGWGDGGRVEFSGQVGRARAKALECREFLQKMGKSLALV